LPDLSSQTFRFLLELAEAEPPVVSSAIAAEAIGDEVRVAVTCGLLLPAANQGGVVLPGDEEVRPILAFDGTAGTLTCFHPEAGFLTVAAEALRSWHLETAELAAVIGRLLGLPASFRPMALVEGLLWDLGAPRLDRAGVPILFARRLADETARCRIRRELELRLGRKPSLLLTSGRHVAPDLVLPAVFAVVPVEEVLERAGPAARLDLPRLAALAGLRQGAAVAYPDLAVACEAEGHWLRMNGKTYTFRGTQARIVRRLYESWAAGEEWMRVQEVLEGAESHVRKLAEAFRGKKECTEVIEVREGNCRLRVSLQPER
jgi:hypothetical protein